MRRLLKWLFRAVEFVFIVLCIYLGSLFLHAQRLPGAWAVGLLEQFVELPVAVELEDLRFGFLHGIELTGLRIRERGQSASEPAMASADSLLVHPLARRVSALGLRYERLPDSYYASGNEEKSAAVRAQLPEIPKFSLSLTRPHILGVAPQRVVADVEIVNNRLNVDRIHLDWPELSEPMSLDGFCFVDLEGQEIYGEVRGSTLQSHIRPLLVALDVPVALPYMDGFTEVPGKVPAYCGWKVDLTNNDFDLDLDLHPDMGKYNGVPMKHADGKIHLHVYTRGTSLNYHQTFGPIIGQGLNGEQLEGTVVVDGTNGCNTVTVNARSGFPVMSLLRIGGFAGDYVDDKVKGNAECQLEFRFPRSMTNNYEVLNGSGHVSIRDGQIMRMKGFTGLIAILADKLPGFSVLTDSTQTSADYVIRNGIIKSDNILIEGTVFSIKMKGEYDAVRDNLDFTVDVRVFKEESMVGKVLRPLTWPFTAPFEFRLTGSAGDPKWKYVHVIDRVRDMAK